MSHSILEPPTHREDIPVSTEEHESLLTWLERGKTHDTIGVLLRKDPECQERMRSLAEGSGALPYLMQEACRAAEDQMHGLWWDVVGSNSYWARIHCYPSIGACTLRGPSSMIRRFFSSPRLSEPDSPVAE